MLYSRAVCPRLSWLLLIHPFSCTWLTTQADPSATRFLKKWCGLCRSADPNRMYLPRQFGGLGLPAISTSYKASQVSKASQLLSSSDRCVQDLAYKKAERESKLVRGTFKPFSLARSILAQQPQLNKQQLIKTAKVTVTKRDHQQRLDHSKGLLKQGQTFNDDLEAALWADVVSKLPDSTMKFAHNAAQDCLPHNQNLFLWKKKPTPIPAPFAATPSPWSMS